MGQEYKYVARITGDTSELEKVINKARGKLQRLNDDEVLIKLDYDGNVSAFNKTFNKMLKAAPELTIQFQYDVNKKILNQEMEKLQQLTNLKMSIDEGTAGKNIQNMVGSLKKAYDDMADETALYSRLKEIVQYANTLEDLGVNLDKSFLVDLEAIAEEYESLDDLLQQNAEKPIKLFKLDKSLDDTIAETQERVDSFQATLEKLKKKGASELSDTTEFKELSDQVKILTADIEEMKSQISNLSGEQFDEMRRSVNELEESLAAALKRIQELSEAKVNPNNISFHVGDLGSNKNRWKSESMNHIIPNMNMGDFDTGDYGYGILGTGVYHSTWAEDLSFSSANPKGYALNIDPSKYKLLVARLDEEAEKLMSFLGQMQGYVIAQGSGYDGWDDVLKGVDTDSLYKKYVNAFGETAMDIKEFSDFVDSMIAQVAEIAKLGMSEDGSFNTAGTKWDHADTPITQLLKKMGYEGIDLRGTKYDSYEQGSTIFDLHPEDIIKVFDTQEEMESYWKNNKDAIKEFNEAASKSLGEAGESIEKLTKYVEELNNKLLLLEATVERLSGLGAVQDAASDVSAAAVEGIKDGQHSHSPSVDGENQADNLIEGYLGTLEDNVGRAEATGEKLSEAVVSGLAEGNIAEVTAAQEKYELALVETNDELKRMAELAFRADTTNAIDSYANQTQILKAQALEEERLANEAAQRAAEIEKQNQRLEEQRRIIAGAAETAFKMDTGRTGANQLMQGLQESYRLTQQQVDETVRLTQAQMEETAIQIRQRELANQFGDAIKEYADDISRAEGNAEELAESLKKAISVTKNAEAGSSLDLLSDLQSQIQYSEKARGTIDKLIKDVSKLNDSDKYVDSFIESVLDLLSRLEELSTQDIISPEQLENIQKATNALKDASKLDVNKTFKELSRSKYLDQISQYLTKYTGLSAETRAELEKIAEAMRKANSSGELKELYDQFVKLKTSARNAGEEVQSMFTNISHRLNDMNAKFIAQFLSWQDLLRYTRQAVDIIKELDYALVDLKKTTSMSSQELKEFYYTANDTAKVTGVTTKEIIDQAAAWSRLGYSSKDAVTEMSALSSQFAQISPGMSVDTATDGLVSTMKAFHVDVADVEREIMDVINKTGNTMATNNEEIVNMLERSSSAMSAANNSIKETIALESAAVQITRNAETTGTAFRTISMRIRGYDEETEEFIGGVEELTGKIADLTKTAKSPGGISLFTDETKSTYKSTYQILKDISEIYNDLTDKDQAALLETLAGKRGGQVLAGILEDFSEVERAMANMEDSAGSADAEMAIVEESIEYKLNNLQQTWVGILQELIDNGMLGQLIDALTAISEVLGDIVTTAGPIPTFIAGLGLRELILHLDKLPGIIQAVNAGLKASDILKVASGANVEEIIASAKAAEEATKAIGTAAGTTGVSGVTKLAGAFKALVPILTNPVTIVLGLTAATYALYKWVDEANERQKEKIRKLDSEYNKLKRELDSTNSELSETNRQIDILQKKGKLSLVEQQELEKLRTQAELLKIAADEQERLTRDKAKETNTENQKLFKNEYFDVTKQQYQDGKEYSYNDYLKDFSSNVIHHDEYANNLLYTMNGLQSAAKGDLNDNPEELLKIYQAVQIQREKALDTVTKMEEKYGSLQEANEKMTAAEKDNFRIAKDVLEETEQYMSGLEGAINSVITELYNMKQTAINAGDDAFKGQIDEMLKLVYLFSGRGAEWNSIKISEIFDTEGIEVTREELEKLAQAGELDDATLEKYPRLKEAIEALSLILGPGETALELFKNELIATGEAAENTADSLEETKKALSFTQSISDLNDLENALNNVGTAMANIDENGKFQLGDLDTIADYFLGLESAEEKVEYETEAVANALKLLGEGSGTIEQQADAINTLADNYLHTSNILDGLTEENKQLYIIRLQEMGIINAEAIVLETLNQQKAQEADIDAILEQAGKDLVSITATEIQELMDEGVITEETAQKIAALAYQKQFANGNPLDTSADINNLIQLLNTLGATTSALEAYNKVKNGANGMPSDVIQKYKEAAQKEINSALNTAKSTTQAKYTVPKVQYNGGSSVKNKLGYTPASTADALSGSAAKAAKDAADSASKAAEDTKEEFKEAYDYFERMIKVLDQSISLLKAHLEDVVGSFAKNTLLNAQEDQIKKKMEGYSSAIAMYSAKASEALSKIPSDVAAKIQSGVVAIDEFVGDENKEVVEAAKEYEQWADKVHECKLQLVELREELRQLELQKFKNLAQDFQELFDVRQTQIDLISKAISLFETSRNKIVGRGFYDESIEQTEKQLSKLYEKQTALSEQMNQAIANGVNVAGDEWFEMLEAVEEVNGAILDAQTKIEEYKNAIIQLYVDSFERESKAYANQINMRQKNIDSLEKEIALIEAAGQLAGRHLYDSQITQLTKQISTLQEERAVLTTKLNDAIANGVKAGTDEWVSMVDAIYEVDAAIKDTELSIKQTEEAIKQLYVTLFEREAERYSNETSFRDKAISALENEMSRLQAAGQLIGESYYTAQRTQTEKTIATLQKERDALVKSMSEATKNGIEVGSEEWISMANSLYDVDTAIQKCTTSLEEFDNAILELHNATFDRIQTRFDNLSSELSNMADMFADKDVATTNNEWTKEGLAQLGLQTEQYELAKKRVAEYNDEIAELNKQYSQGKYSTTEYTERLAKLQSEQWKEVKAADSAKKAIIELNKARVEKVIEGINKETEAYKKLIAAAKEALSTQKDLHDYEKSLSDQNKSIEEIQRQLAAIEGDTSLSAAAKRAQLQEELAEERKSLAELEYQHSIETQQEALDQQLENYQTERDAEIETLQNSLEDAQTLLNESFEAVRTNALTIGQEILTMAQELNITMSPELTAPWQAGEAAIASYSELFNIDSSEFMTRMSEVENSEWSLQEQANSTGTSIVNMLSATSDNIVMEVENANEKFRELQREAEESGRQEEEAFAKRSDELVSQIDNANRAQRDLEAASQDASRSIADAFGNRADELVNTIENARNSAENLANMSDALADSLNSSIDGSYSGASAVGALDSIADAANGVAEAARNAANALSSMMDAQASAQQSYTGKIYEQGSDGDYYYSGYGTVSGNNIWEKDGRVYVDNGYARGTQRVSHDQIAWTQEKGPEAIISPSSGAILTPLKSGDGVIPADMTKNLFAWGNFNPEEFATKLIENAGVPNAGNIQTNTMQIGSLVTVNGDVNDTMTMMQIAANQAANKIKQSFKELSNGLNG